MRGLDGKAVLVTGAGSGIGRESALRFASAGCAVMAVDRDGESAAKTAAEIAAGGQVAAHFKADVSVAEQVTAMVAATVETFGGLDCAFNHAGAGHRPKPMDEVSDEELETALSVNVKGTWNCIKHEVRYMRERGGGAIVNTSSGVGLRATPRVSAYGTSKAAVAYLTAVAALEYAAEGIRVNAICPGPTVTPGFEALADDPVAWREEMRRHVPIGRLGEPIDIAHAALWLCSEESSFVTGAVLRVDGGEGA